MTDLALAVLLLLVPACCAVTLYGVHRMLRSHATVMGAVLGRHARDITYALEQAERRVSEAARTGRVSREGPARLRD